MWFTDFQGKTRQAYWDRIAELISYNFNRLEGKKILYSCIPRHLLTIDEAEILKNVVLHSVATAFASIVCKQKWYDTSN